MSQLQFLKGNTGKDKLYYDENLFYQLSPNKWYCDNADCGVTLTTSGVGLEMKIEKQPTLQHFHNPIHIHDFMCRKAEQNMKERISNEPHIFTSTIYNEEYQKLQEINKIPIEAIAEYLKPYNCYKPTFEKKRAKNRPILPKTEDDIDFTKDETIKYTQTIEQEKFLIYDNKKKNNRIIIFAADYGLKLLSESNRWHSDGTFFMTPKPFKQTYLIHAYKSSIMLPCVYVLLQNKETNTYKEVLGAIKDIATEKGYHLNPETILTDFECAAQQAYRYHWTGITIKGCYFHFKQAILRHIQSLKESMKQDDIEINHLM
jgi:hypothetical protein